MKINLVMIVKDEERCLRRCLKAAGSLVDEIIIADTGSSDRTVEIAGEMGASVLHFTWINDFSAARNFALEHSDADWNLILDADEILRPCSRKGLEKILKGRQGTWLGGLTRFDAYRDDDGISHGMSVLPRLLPRGIRYQGLIHEQPEGYYPCYSLPLCADHDGYLHEDKGERNLPYLRRAVEQYPEDGYYQFQLAFTLRNLKRLDESLVYFRNFYRLAVAARQTKSSGSREAYLSEGVVLYLYTLLDLGAGEHLDEAGEVIDQEMDSLGDWPDFCFVCGLFYMKRVLSDVARYVELLPNIERCYLRCLELGDRPQMGGVVGTGSFKAAYNLGAWYEVSGQPELAVKYYRMAAKDGYEPARERLRGLKQ